MLEGVGANARMRAQKMLNHAHLGVLDAVEHMAAWL